MRKLMSLSASFICR